jgi:hypothetical protein
MAYVNTISQMAASRRLAPAHSFEFRALLTCNGSPFGFPYGEKRRYTDAAKFASLSLFLDPVPRLAIIGAGRDLWRFIMAGDRMRPYSGKIRTRSLILFLFSLALMITLDSFYGRDAFPRWFLALVVTLVTGSSLAYIGCVLYDWWAAICNKIQG